MFVFVILSFDRINVVSLTDSSNVSVMVPENNDHDTENIDLGHIHIDL